MCPIFTPGNASHGGAQWCHLANTMDNLLAAVVKQLNYHKVMQTPLGDPRNRVSHKRAHWRHVANTIAYINEALMSL